MSTPSDEEHDFSQGKYWVEKQVYGQDYLESGSLERKQAEYFLDNAYELPPTPSGVRPVVRKREGDRYVIEYEAYCVYCGEVWKGDEYSSWVDIESAEMVFTEAIGYGFQRLDDGRVVCDVDEKRSGCWKWCKCSECEGEDKIIGIDQSDCQSKPWMRDEMEARFG